MIGYFPPRKPNIVFVIVALVFLHTGVRFSRAEEGVWKPGLGNPLITQVTENVTVITGLYHTAGPLAPVSAGIVYTDESVVFIDAGMTIASAEFIIETARKQTAHRKNLYVILTHHHSDHIFGMRVFRERGAVVIGHYGLTIFIENRGQEYKDILQNMLGWDEEKGNEIFGDILLTPPDIDVASDTTLYIDGDEICLMMTPGHVPTELVVYHPASKTLFAGDAVYEGVDPTTHFGGPDEWREWIRHLERLQSLDIETICPGHGKLCGKDELGRNIGYLESLVHPEDK